MQSRTQFLLKPGLLRLNFSFYHILVLVLLCTLLLLPLTACTGSTTTSSAAQTTTTTTAVTVPTTGEITTTSTSTPTTTTTSAPTTTVVPTETYVLPPLEALDKVTYDKVTTSGRNLTVIKSFDLNSDGQKEKITLVAEGWNTTIGGKNVTVYINYTIQVGSHKLASRTLPELKHNDFEWMFEPRFNICDIDASDRFREIAVSYAGEDVYSGTTFYRFDGQSLKSLGTISGQYGKITNYYNKTTYMGNIKIAGNNIVHTSSPGNLAIMQFFPDEYRLNSAGILARIVKDLYPINQQHTVGVTLTLRKSRTDSSDGITITKGEKVTLKACDNKQWVSVANAKGEIGWFAMEGYDKVKGTNIGVQTLFPDLVVGG